MPYELTYVEDKDTKKGMNNDENESLDFDNRTKITKSEGGAQEWSGMR